LRLLVSVVNKEEAFDSIEGGAHIIDVKNPKEGSLGANFPYVIRAVNEVIQENIELSATIGDLPNLPGTASLAALGATVCGVDYVKVGLFGVKTFDEASTLMGEVVKAVKDHSCHSKVIASGYADFRNFGCLSPLNLPDVAYESEADGVLVDAKVKNEKDNLFSFLLEKELETFVKEAHNCNLLAALAGSLEVKHIPKLYSLDADIIGVRGAVCSKKDRLNGKLEKEKVTEFVNALKEYK
jgi:uncharacterized protein (UPF0264 family)